ncbi:ABC transporter ATP-binding protein [Nocardioides mangrovicus]|uniref:ABC transporter ATP-binding protein n=1 Tax=Nocardioides mangrovicus TaxID=2478913 RepID=A0A3L8P8B6_9ACTN|nr:ABC transporter ATP-binding protein [Nocardioides mangrovicus]
MLEVRDVEARYGDALALSRISLEVAEQQTLAVIGANGAGKSTLLRCLAGLMPVSAGQIRFRGESLDRVPAHRRVAAGISLVPEGRRLFASLTVTDNLLVGAHQRRPGPWDLDAVFEALPLVAQRRDRYAGALSGGEQQAVAIGRALMANPELLLLDEVSLGLAPVVIKQVYEVLPAIKAAGTTVLVVEQDVRQALAVADEVHCLLEGRTTLTGPAGSVSQEEVARAYFGV